MLVRYPRARYTIHRNCLYQQPVRDRHNRRDPRAEEGTVPFVPDPGPSPAPPAQGIVINREQRTASVDGRFLALTYLEFELLAHLVAHPRRVHSRAQLTNEVWGQPAIGNARTVDVHIARLRRKLGPEHRVVIVTVHQVGYTYAPTDAPA
ncbi:winged helix family transcriptional regulator [Streptomyces sp. GS7]|nr:winged helix family transcriptional regulator [Streptomyces sp. GS7]